MSDNLIERVWQWMVRAGFRLLYNEFAWSYDPVSWIVSMGKWRKWQRTTLPFVMEGRVLEVAHGPGHLLADLERAGCQVYGVDLSSSMVGMARKRLLNLGARPRLVRGRVESLPFAAASFEGVVSTFPTIFIIESATAKCIFDALKPGGRLVVVLMARFTGRGVLQRLLEWLYRITGQRPGGEKEVAQIKASFTSTYHNAGFLTAFEQVTVDNSEVTLFLGTKPTDE